VTYSRALYKVGQLSRDRYIRSTKSVQLHTYIRSRLPSLLYIEGRLPRICQYIEINRNYIISIREKYPSSTWTPYSEQSGIESECPLAK
jgi:hypothetical protein